MKIITVGARKGGVGKTTFTYLGATYLVQKLNKKVLVIDGDPPSKFKWLFFLILTKITYWVNYLMEIKILMK